MNPQTRGKLVSKGSRAFVLAAVYVFLFSPIVIVVASSFDYGERAYVVFPP